MLEMQKCVSANMVGIFFEGQREFMNEEKGQFQSRKVILSKVIIEKSRGERSLMEQDTNENVS